MSIRAWILAALRFAGSAPLRLGGHSQPVLSTAEKPRSMDFDSTHFVDIDEPSMNFNSTHFVDVDEPLLDYEARAEDRAPRLQDMRTDFQGGEWNTERVMAHRKLGKDAADIAEKDNIHRCYPNLRAYYEERVRISLTEGRDPNTLPPLPERSNFRTITESFSCPS